MFREAVVKSQGQRLFGVINLAQPVSTYLIVALIFFILVMSVVFLSYAKYARKETVKGYLVPSVGIRKIYTNRSGYIDELLVRVGDQVNKGDVLAKIVVHHSQTNGDDYNENLLIELNELLNILKTEYEVIQKKRSLEFQGLKQKKKDLHTSIQLAKKQIQLLNKQYQIDLSSFESNQHLYIKNHISDAEFKTKRKNKLASENALESRKAAHLNMTTQFHEIQGEIKEFPLETKIRLSRNLQQQNNIKRQIEEVRNNYLFTVIATETGTVSSISSKEGEVLATHLPLLSIIPTGTKMMAELFLPSRSVGFVQLNDKVKLRFDAFPYQRFGFIKGNITSIDNSLILNQKNNLPIQFNEPVYRVQTSLAKQSIVAYGREYGLKAGLFLEADIILEERALLDWIFEPLYSLTGRIN